MQTENKKNIIKHSNVSFYNNDQPDMSGWEKRMVLLDKGMQTKSPMRPSYSVPEKRKGQLAWKSFEVIFEAVVGRCSLKKVFLKILQYSQKTPTLESTLLKRGSNTGIFL